MKEKHELSTPIFAVQCTLGWPKKKICEWLELMGEVIIKWFYFYYFRYRQLFERTLLKNHGAQSTRNAAENYMKKIRGFSEILLHNISSEFT